MPKVDPTKEKGLFSRTNKCFTESSLLTLPSLRWWWERGNPVCFCWFAATDTNPHISSGRSRWKVALFLFYLLVDLHQMRTVLALSVLSFCVRTNRRNVNHFTDFDSYMHTCSKFVLKVTCSVIPHLHHLVSQITHGEMSEGFLGIFLEHFDQVDYLLFPKLLHLSIKHIITVLWTTATDTQSQQAFDNLLQSLLTVL